MIKIKKKNFDWRVKLKIKTNSTKRKKNNKKNEEKK